MWLRRRRNGLSTGLYDYNQHLDRHHADRNTDTNADPGTDTYPNANSPADTHANSHPDPRSASSDACGSDDDIDV